MRMVDIIHKKRNGQTLSTAEWDYVIQAYTADQLPDYQMAALLMAIYFQEINGSETADLTLAMAKSGRMLDLSQIEGIKVDKHSTGGVADTTTLILAPLVAAAGVPVAKMSGRGLGFTGGTIDKLESIPGFRTGLTEAEFIHTVKAHGIAVMGQTADIAPADGKIYALRDVTATIESIPLIASSIMSKKIAAGADRILLDVKVGSGAFMQNLDDAIRLAKEMVRIGRLVGRQTKAVITSMDQPLGMAVGNSLEVIEAIEVLRGGHTGSALYHVCLTLGSHLLTMANVATDEVTARQRLAESLADGSALRKFEEFVIAQGGNGEVVRDFSLLPQPRARVTVQATKAGVIQAISTADIGLCATLLGAGREHKGQQIDLAAGLMMACRIGDKVEVGQPLAELFAANSDNFAEVSSRLLGAISIGPKPVQTGPLVYGLVDENGYQAK
ncbi:thymidine phosphorylase [Anaerosporomusa subterranea]|uniref:Pyrimidine-nucleoside phosphorylase n=1 Tax=Anaerosporomusa subterranea TaxID=1794912 RepID=A0A154BVI3_ANASB|nr:pyrimidine-nucleoside phosphorylase [Anaerosporomusa subterranea]KYZ77498.1 thymidine phosphorylase [Anaerosporomusa subterranea]